MPLPTTIATWPSQTTRSLGRGAFGTRGVRSLDLLCLRKVLAALAFAGSLVYLLLL